jgi:7-cyano-7-deazaguanine reductase
MKDIPLGKPTRYPDRYDPGLLAPLARTPARGGLGVGDPLPFVGEDVWHGYEFSWLDPGGLPRVALLRLVVPAASPRMVESKSMKLYLNGFAQARFASAGAVGKVLERDLGEACGAAVEVSLDRLEGATPPLGVLPGDCLDELPVAIRDYQRNPELLEVVPGGGVVEETLHTHLFRSLCPVTGQPDWASLLVRYRGSAIRREGLLAYLVSYRSHQAFHENTVEQIFVDLKARCGCEDLTVGGYFLRRGGLDINPFRADRPGTWPDVRLLRQ